MGIFAAQLQCVVARFHRSIVEFFVDLELSQNSETQYQSDALILLFRINLIQIVEDVLLEEAHFLFVVVVQLPVQLPMTQSEAVRTSVAIVDFLEPTSTSLVDVV